MQTLMPLAADVARLLMSRKETVAIAESSAGGLIAASLLAVPGASAYFLGGAVIYTLSARRALLGITDVQMQGLRASSEPYAMLLAQQARARHGAVWGVGETGAAGPTGNRYGDAAGHACIAVEGPHAHVFTVATGSDDRPENMRAFARAALQALQSALAHRPT